MQQVVLNVVFLCGVNIFFMISGVFLNCVEIISLWKSSQYEKKLCYFMTLVLSCCDLAVVTITHPLLISSTMNFLSGDYNELHEQIRVYICVLLNGFSMWTLLMLNIERFLGIVYPIFHRTSITKRILNFLLSVVFLANVIQSTLSFQNLLIPDNMLVIVYLPGYLLLLMYLNYKMYVVAKAKQRRNIPGAVIPAVAVNHENVKRVFELKKVSTCFLAVICFFLCCSPGIVLSSIFYAQETSLYDKSVVPPSLWMSTFASMNSTFNCLIFFWKNAILRREGMKIMNRFCSKGDN